MKVPLLPSETERSSRGRRESFQTSVQQDIQGGTNVGLTDGLRELGMHIDEPFRIPQNPVIHKPHKKR